MGKMETYSEALPLTAVGVSPPKGMKETRCFEKKTYSFVLFCAHYLPEVFLLQHIDPSVCPDPQADGVTPTRGPRQIHCLTIIGQIEGHQALSGTSKSTQYEHILPQLAAVEESPDIGGLLILLNTAGGDVEAGLAIAELIAGMSKPTAALVLGGSHSIGVPIAVAAKRTFIAPTGTMVLHPVRITGTVLGVPQTSAYFRRVQGRIEQFVTGHSRITVETLRRLMQRTDELVDDIGSVVTGKEAVELGLCDAVGGLQDALRALHEMMEVQQDVL